MHDTQTIKYVIEVSVYLFALVISAFATRAIPFHKFLSPLKMKEAWVLYIVIMLTFTYCLGSLILKFFGIEIWLT